MSSCKLLSGFFKLTEHNPFLGPSHVSLYVALVELAKLQQFQEPLIIKRPEVMKLARIRGIATYHKVLYDLVEGGCIKYYPSYTRNGSVIYL